MIKRKQDYAIDELAAICCATLAAIPARFTTPAKRLGDGERCQLLKQSRVPLKNNIHKVYSTDCICEVFDFSSYESLAIKSQDQIDRSAKEVEDKYLSIKDKVALGDETGALHILTQFRQFCSELLETK